MEPLGQLKRRSVGEVWSHEAGDFTPWLKDNVDELAKVLSRGRPFAA
jgi:hypothetical protein